jgi:predicted ATP-dependent serine protease
VATSSEPLSGRGFDWICIHCGTEWSLRPPVCSCWRNDGLVPLPSRQQGRDVRTAPRRVLTVKASALKPSMATAPYGPPFDSWTLGEPHAVALIGPPGSGKSTLATRMAISAARRTMCLYVSAEQGPESQALCARFLRAGLDDITAARLDITGARTMLELDDVLAQNDARLVILDSVDALGASPEGVVTALAGRSWISVHHTNNHGGAYGGNAWAHVVDTAIYLADGLATPRKNRGGPMHSIPVFTEEKPAP